MSNATDRSCRARTAGGRRPAGVASVVLARLEQLAGGLGTSALALLVLVWTAATAVLCLLGIGVLVLPVVSGGAGTG